MNLIRGWDDALCVALRRASKDEKEICNLDGFTAVVVFDDGVLVERTLGTSRFSFPLNTVLLSVVGVLSCVIDF